MRASSAGSGSMGGKLAVPIAGTVPSSLKPRGVVLMTWLAGSGASSLKWSNMRSIASTK